MRNQDRVVNGNAGKVLDNPVVMSGNTLMFYSHNVANSMAGSSSSTSAPESCSPVMVNGPLAGTAKPSRTTRSLKQAGAPGGVSDDNQGRAG